MLETARESLKSMFEQSYEKTLFGNLASAAMQVAIFVSGKHIADQIIRLVHG